MQVRCLLSCRRAAHALCGGELPTHAGGLVVHVAAGFSGLMGAAMLGPAATAPAVAPDCNLRHLAGGAWLLWVGAMSLCASSALEPSAGAALSLLNTQVRGVDRPSTPAFQPFLPNPTSEPFRPLQCCAAASALVWLLQDWAAGKPSVTSACVGAIAGVVCMAAGCDKVSPLGALAMGAIIAVLGRCALAVACARAAPSRTLDSTRCAGGRRPDSRQRSEATVRRLS